MYYKKHILTDSVLNLIIKPQFLGQKKTMTKKISEIEDGHYKGIIHSVEKKESSNYTLFKFLMSIEGFDDDLLFEHVEFVSEKNKYFLYSRVTIPLGLYASDSGIDSLCSLEDLYVEFEKTTNYYNNKEYPQVTFEPLFKVQRDAPVGLSNCTLDLDSLFNIDQSTTTENVNNETEFDYTENDSSNYESFDEDDIPF